MRDAPRAGTLTDRERDAILTASAERSPLPGATRRLAARDRQPGAADDPGADREPVIVVDASDSLTRRLGSRSTRDELVAGFFGPVLRALTERHAGLVVAVHDEYGRWRPLSRRAAVEQLDR